MRLMGVQYIVSILFHVIKAYFLVNKIVFLNIYMESALSTQSVQIYRLKEFYWMETFVILWFLFWCPNLD